MLSTESLLKLLIIIALGAALVIIHRLDALIRAIKDMNQDLSVIRLDNVRTLAELRRKQKR